MFHDIVNLIEVLVSGFLAIGGGFGLSSFLKKNSAVQRNEHIASLEKFAADAVLYAQQYMANGSQQQEIAIKNLKERVAGNKLDQFVTDDQLLAYVQHTYAQQKANGQLTAIKPSISEPSVDVAKTQQVTEVSK